MGKKRNKNRKESVARGHVSGEGVSGKKKQLRPPVLGNLHDDTTLTKKKASDALALLPLEEEDREEEGITTPPYLPARIEIKTKVPGRMIINRTDTE